VKTHPELRARLREIAGKTPPGVASWGHTRTCDFKRAIKAARIAADHPLSVPWMLEQRIKEIQGFHK
jgi:hypothetical protein